MLGGQSEFEVIRKGRERGERGQRGKRGGGKGSTYKRRAATTSTHYNTLTL